jgi:hypothetical protein
MSRERLAQLMEARRASMKADPAHETTNEAILSVFSALDKHEITEGQALRILGWQAIRLPHAPTHAALYRQAAADLRQMQREEH